jgi:1-acyl-sn-glycerol-3-phosphate acyltransferase
MLRRTVRLPLIILHLLLGSLVAMLLLRPRSGRAPIQPVMVWSRTLCRILGVRIVTCGQPRPGAVLFVANHVSWLDIFCIATVCPTHFLAKQEVADWPVFGWLARRAGTVFIRRGGENVSGAATEQLTWRLRQGDRILVFPEGTSTDGRSLRRFHSGLFQAAIHARCPVQAVAVRYPCGAGVHPVVPFVGDDGLVPHLWRLLGEGGIVAELHFCEPLPPASHTRDGLARQTHAQIGAVLQRSSPRAIAVQAGFD